MTAFKSELDRAVQNLKNQGIVVTQGGISEDGIVFQVGGYVLTGPQILKLQETGQLHLQGIKALSNIRLPRPRIFLDTEL